MPVLDPVYAFSSSVRLSLPVDADHPLVRSRSRHFEKPLDRVAVPLPAADAHDLPESVHLKYDWMQGSL